MNYSDDLKNELFVMQLNEMEESYSLIKEEIKNVVKQNNTFEFDDSVNDWV